MRTGCSTMTVDVLCDTWENTNRIHPETQEYHTHSGDAHLELYQHHGDLQDLNTALSEYQKGLDLSNDSERDSEKKAFYHDKIGKCWSARAVRSNDFIDVEKSIAHYQLALQLAARYPTECILYHYNLGSTLLMVYDLRGLKENSNFNPFSLLNEAITHFETAINLSIESDEPLNSYPNSNSSYHEVLGRTFLKRFQLSFNISDLRNAILHLRFSADTFTPYEIRQAARYRELGDLFYQLSSLVRSEKPQNSHPESSIHLGNSIRYYTRSLTLASEDEPDCPALYNAIGLSYFARFELSELKHNEDGQVAIRHFQRAIDLSPGIWMDPRACEYHLNLGTAYLGCYVSAMKTEASILSIEMLEDAIYHLRMVLDSSQECSQGLTDSLNQAVAYGRKAVSCTHRSHPYYLTVKEMIKDLADRNTFQQYNNCSTFKFDGLSDILSKM